MSTDVNYVIAKNYFSAVADFELRGLRYRLARALPLVFGNNIPAEDIEQAINEVVWQMLEKHDPDWMQELAGKG